MVAAILPFHQCLCAGELDGGIETFYNMVILITEELYT